MKKNSRVRRWLAMILCMTLVLSSNVVSMAAEENGTEVQAITEEPVIEETEPAAADEPVPEDITETETLMTETPETVPTEEPATEEPTEEPVDTEVPTETVTEPETPEVPETPETPAQDETEEPVQEETPAETERNEVALQEWVQEVNGATVKVVAEKGVLPEEAVLSAVEITDEAEVEQLEKAAEEQAIEKKVAIENIIAYDIKFLVNSEEVQPNGNVQVTVDTPIIESGQEASVLHVDDSNMAEDMQGTVDEQGNVVFETPHFSKYVIVQEGDSEVEITIEHYNMNNEKIYADDVLTLPVGGKVNNYAKATNWNVEQVFVDGKELSEEELAEIKVAKKTEIKICYSPKETEVSGATTFYDYTIKAGTDWRNNEYSINMPSNYNGTGGSNRNRMTAGVDGANYKDYRSQAAHSNWASEFGGEAYYHKNPYLGLVTGLDENGDVVFSVPQPGFFVDSGANVWVQPGMFSGQGEHRDLRKVYTDYTLKFAQTGDTYTLNRVEKNAQAVKNGAAGENFFPLDDVKVQYGSGTDSEDAHNFYFGMRYDVNFKIGDYVGPLNYTFKGDDDLWVILDGKRVVIDLGGIHEALEGTVDLWNYILHEGYKDDEKASLSIDEKQKEHTLTILYMERGANSSNCEMKFTLPSATISEVTEVPMADLLLKKVKKDGSTLEGAQFALKDSTGAVIQTATSTSDGSVKFSKLKEGTYTLEETQAPSGYIPSLETWVVKVEVNEEGTAVATLYLSDGKTEYKERRGSYYEVVNVTRQEVIDSSIEYDKTAHIENWEERIYNIDITASSIAKETITKDGTAEIMLVLDLSGSMNYGNIGASNKDASYERIGRYSEVMQSLDTTKVYYYGSKKCPMIYIEDKWQYYKNETEGWVEVPNASRNNVYTKASRLTGVKEALNSFVSSIAETSPNIKLGVTTFSSGNYTNNEVLVPLTTVGTDKVSIIKNINKVEANGGTNPGKGLELAKEELTKNETTGQGVSQYVILFTDGTPTGSGSEWSDSAAGYAKVQSDLIKAEDIHLYTIGFGLTERAKNWLSGASEEWIDYDGKEMNASGIASTDCAWTAENMDELKELFKQLQDTITKDVDIKEAEIKDVIDPRFVILDDEGKPITKEYPGIDEGITLENGGTVYFDSETGYQYIVWTNQTIPAKGKDGKQWHQTIKVKAQEDYIGGNGIETNISPDSQIHTGYGDVTLPQPTVNVKVDLTVANAGEKIFLGENVPTDAETLKKLFDESNYAKYNGVEAQDFVMEWYRDASCTNKITVEDMAKEYPTGKTEFYLKVTYDAGKPKADSNTNTNGNVNGTETNGQYLVTAVNSQDASKAYGIYKVEVVSGEIDITKEITKPGNIDLEGAPIFTFKIEYRKPGVEDNAPATETYYRTIGFGEGEKTKEAETLTNLPKGTYKVTELDTQKYKLKSVSDNQSTCSVKPDNSSITFTLGGSKVDERANTEWTHGKAKFVNEKEAPNTNTDTDAYVNRFVKNADGTYTVQQIRVPEKKEESNN